MRGLALLPLLLIVLAPGARAEDAPAPAPKWDDLSKTTVTHFEHKLTYRLGMAGVKTATCKTTFTMGSAAGEMTTASTFKWDGKKASLAWDNAMMGAQLAKQGWGLELYQAHFKENVMLESLKTASLTATKSEDTVSIAVTGGKSGFKNLIYKNGVLIKSTGVAPVMGQQLEYTLDFTYVKVGDKYLVSGWTVAFDMPGMGPFKEKTTFAIEKQGEFHVWKSAVSESKMGKRTAVFSWTLNAPAEPAK